MTSVNLSTACKIITTLAGYAIAIAFKQRHKLLISYLFGLSNITTKVIILYDAFKSSSKIIKTFNTQLHNDIINREIGLFYFTVSGLCSQAIFWSLVPNTIHDDVSSNLSESLIASELRRNRETNVYMSSHPRVVKALEMTKSHLNPTIITFLVSILIAIIPPVKSLLTSPGSLLNVSVYETSLTVGRALSILQLFSLGSNFRLCDKVSLSTIWIALIKLIPFPLIGYCVLWGLNVERSVRYLCLFMNFGCGSSLSFVVFANVKEIYVIKLI